MFTFHRVNSARQTFVHRIYMRGYNCKDYLPKKKYILVCGQMVVLDDIHS